MDEHAGYIARALATTGGHLAIGLGGATLYFDGGWLSGAIPDAIKAEAVSAGLPVIDSRRLPFDVVLALVARGPMAAVGREPDMPPHHPLAYASPEAVAAAYRAAGAEVLTLPLGVAAAVKEEEGCAGLRDG